MNAKKFLHTIIRDYHKKKKTYDKLGFKFTNGISSQDWEVFAALLLNDRANGKLTGPDLTQYEVKSSKQGKSYEYQYHKNTGLQKLESDKTVDHVFVVYSLNYRDGAVMLVPKESLVSVFEGWKQDVLRSYGEAEGQAQRCRKQVSAGFVKEHGKVVYKWAIRVD
jgi:hypothetical protein